MVIFGRAGCLRNPENLFHNEQGISPKFSTIIPEEELKQ
jgi:hypothetical protein